jgi:hypothetical protein
MQDSAVQVTMNSDWTGNKLVIRISMMKKITSKNILEYKRGKLFTKK